MVVITNFVFPKWYSIRKYPFIDIDEFEEYYHIFCAKREKSVRYSLGCINKIDDSKTTKTT